MNFFKNKILKIVYSDNYKNPFLSLRFFLFIFSKIYSFITDLRLFFYKNNFIKSYKSDAFVISIGNITAGGTGKTPMAIYIAQGLLEINGLKPAIVMRGYKGGLEKKGGIACDGKNHKKPFKFAGDEAALICSRLDNVLVLCGKNKKESVKTAVKEFGCNVVILDDGFSHLKVKRDLDLVLLDYEKPYGNFYTLPRGILREKKQNIKRADAVIYTRTKNPQISFNNTFFCFHETFVEKIVDGTKKSGHKKVFLFCGLGDNHAFYKSTINFGFNVCSALFFEDHHEFDKKDIEKIIKKAKQDQCDSFITTNKDYCRIKDININFPFDLIVLDVKIKFYGNEFDKYLTERLRIN